jgi:hypothetical protein
MPEDQTVSDFLEYSFRIVGPKPDTMPMSRLAAYMAELARLIGSQDLVHFQRIEDKSVAIVVSAPQSEIPLISPRIRAASRGEASSDAASPWRKINEYLAEDGWDAEMRLPRSAELIVFPGQTKATSVLRAVNQPTSVQGRLIRLEGAGEVVRIGLDIDGDLTARISVDAHHAQQLAKFFHKDIRLSGEGKWKRDSQGRWSLDSLYASSFEPLDDLDLQEALHRLRDTIGHDAGEEIVKAVNELRSA